MSAETALESSKLCTVSCHGAVDTRYSGDAVIAFHPLLTSQHVLACLVIGNSAICYLRSTPCFAISHSVSHLGLQLIGHFLKFTPCYQRFSQHIRCCTSALVLLYISTCLVLFLSDRNESMHLTSNCITRS